MPTYTPTDGKPRPSSYIFLGFTHRIPSVETVATLAASVMKRGNIGEAVETALSLLEASAEGIYLLEQENEGARLPDRRHFDFIEGAKYITGQKRNKRAKDYLLAFWDKLGRKPSERETIAHHEKNGFTGGEVEKLKAQYWRMKKNKKII